MVYTRSFIRLPSRQITGALYYVSIPYVAIRKQRNLMIQFVFLCACLSNNNCNGTINKKYLPNFSIDLCFSYSHTFHSLPLRYMWRIYTQGLFYGCKRHHILCRYCHAQQRIYLSNMNIIQWKQFDWFFCFGFSECQKPLHFTGIHTFRLCIIHLFYWIKNSKLLIISTTFENIITLFISVLALSGTFSHRIHKIHSIWTNRTSYT